MPTSRNLVTLELQTARSSEKAAAVFLDFLLSLPKTQSDFTRHLRKHSPFFLEILSLHQTITFLLTVDSKDKHFFTSQLIAAYPEVKITEHTTSPTENLRGETAAVKELLLKNASYLPLRVTADSSTTDPLSSVLTVLSKLTDDSTGLIQICVERVDDSWKNKGERLINKPKEETYLAPTMGTEIQRKLEQAGFSFRLSLLAKADSASVRNNILGELIKGFGIYSNSNQFRTGSLPFSTPPSVNQVLNHTLKPRAQYLSATELANLYHLPHKGLMGVKNIAWGKQLQGEPPENLPTFQNMTEAEKNDLNIFAKAEHKNQDQPFGLKTDDRRRHVYVIGKTGTGKSTLLANMIINDLKHNQGLAVIDPHGDLIDTVLDYIPKHRINDTIVFDPSDPHSTPQLNIFEGGSTVHRELIASGIVSMFQKLYAYSWGPRLEYVLRNTLLTLLSGEARLEDIVRLLTDPIFREKILEKLEDPVLRSFWVNEFNTMTDKQRSETISPILNKVGQFVTSPLVRRAVNAKQSSFNIEDVINDGKILLINVSQGKLGEDNAALLGAMMITKLQLAAMNRVNIPEEQRRDFYLYIDEFQNFATNSFIKILSEARKYRLNLTLANQYIDQVSPEVQAAIFGNAGSMMSFVLGANDASHFEREFGQLYTPEDLVSLARYEVICKLMIDGQVSRPFPASTLPLAASKNQSREKVLSVSRERWGKQ